MTDNVDSTGVPLDSDEMEDPGSNENAPDPLIGEQAQSGALSKVGSKNDQESRAAAARAGMDSLRAQYANTAGQASDAYAAQRKTLEDATQRLLGMSAGPSPQEAAYRVAAAVGTGDSRGSFNPAGISAAHAQILQEQREAEMAKNQLISNYGMQIPQTQLAAANQRMNQITQQMRIQQSDINNSSNAANKAPVARDKYWTQDPNDPTKFIDNPAMRQADIAQKATEAANAAKIKQAAAQSNMGVIAPEVVEYVQKNMQMPPGFSRNPQLVKQAFDLAHQKNVDEGVSTNDAFLQAQSNKATVPALAALTKQQALVTSFEQTAQKNADLALSLSSKYQRSGSPWANEWINAANKKLTGNSDLAQFSAANDTFLAEYAKIMNSANAQGSGATSDTAMAHARAMLNDAMSKGTYADVIATLRKDMANRMSSMESTRQQYLQNLAHGIGGNPAPAPAAPAQQGRTAPPTLAPGASSLLDKWAPLKPAGT